MPRPQHVSNVLHGLQLERTNRPVHPFVGKNKNPARSGQCRPVNSSSINKPIYQHNFQLSTHPINIMPVRSNSIVIPLFSPSNAKFRPIPDTPRPGLTCQPTLSGGDPSDASHHFAAFPASTTSASSSNHSGFYMTAPVTPLHPCSLSNTLSCSTIWSWDSSQIHCFARSPSLPPIPLQQLQAQVRHLETMMSAHHTARSLFHIIRLSPHVPIETLIAENVIPAVCLLSPQGLRCRVRGSVSISLYYRRHLPHRPPHRPSALRPEPRQ